MNLHIMYQKFIPHYHGDSLCFLVYLLSMVWYMDERELNGCCTMVTSEEVITPNGAEWYGEIALVTLCL